MINKIISRKMTEGICHNKLIEIYHFIHYFLVYKYAVALQINYTVLKCIVVWLTKFELEVS